MTMPLDPATSLDYSSAEQNVQLQPSSYQSTQTTPTPPTPPTPPTSSSTSTSASTSSSTSTTGPAASVQISYNAQIQQLSSQGMSAADIAESMGTTVAAVDTLLDITPTTIPSTTSTSSTSTTTTPTVSL
jgi:hypothetical protein